MSAWDDMAHDGGYRGDEAKQVARMLEEQERERALGSPETSLVVSQGSSPILRLHSSDLLSKWGFNDGDMPEAVYDYCEEHGISHADLDWHSTLVKLVRLCLLPALDQTVDVYEINTIHNPIRARTVDGEKDWSETDIDFAVVLTPEYVDVPMARVVELAVIALRGEHSA